MLASLETATRRDAVDVQIRAAISPTVDPLLAAQSRTPAIANLLAPFFGLGTPLVRCPILREHPRGMASWGTNDSSAGALHESQHFSNWIADGTLLAPFSLDTICQSLAGHAAERHSYSFKILTST